MRLKDRVVIVVGSGQSPGEGMGNGRATALTFAREGAKVLCVDHHPDTAKETVDMIAAKGGTALNFGNFGLKATEPGRVTARPAAWQVLPRCAVETPPM